MKTFLKHTAYFLLQLIAIATHAQSKVVVEQIQSYSMVSPTANYWHLPNDIKPLIEALDSDCSKKLI